VTGAGGSSTPDPLGGTDDMMIDTQGGCLCGAVRYRFTGEPLAFYQCHCTDCQRQTGSAFGLSMIARREELTTLAGEPARFRVSMSDGRVKCGRFCANCAARVWGEPVRFPQLVVLRPGTFDTPPAVPPFGDIWTRSARPWVSFTEGPRFEVQPEDVLALVRAWQGKTQQ
jgi:hypothetical protein